MIIYDYIIFILSMAPLPLVQRSWHHLNLKHHQRNITNGQRTRQGAAVIKSEQAITMFINLFLLEAPKGVTSQATIAKKVMSEAAAEAEAVECYNYY